MAAKRAYTAEDALRIIAGLPLDERAKVYDGVTASIINDLGMTMPPPPPTAEDALHLIADLPPDEKAKVSNHVFEWLVNTPGFRRRVGEKAVELLQQDLGQYLARFGGDPDRPTVGSVITTVASLRQALDRFQRRGKRTNVERDRFIIDQRQRGLTNGQILNQIKQHHPEWMQSRRGKPLTLETLKKVVQRQPDNGNAAHGEPGP